MTGHRRLLILQWNCRSLRANGDSLHHLANLYNADVILLNETWLRPHIRFSFPNFHVVRQDRIDGYGGCAILVKKGIPFTSAPLPHLSSSSSAQPSLLAIQTSFGGKSIIILTIYIPPTAVISSYEFESFFNSIPLPFICSGDFNAKSPAWGCSTRNSLGDCLLEALDSTDIIMLNDDSGTHFDLAPTPPTASIFLSVPLN